MPRKILKTGAVPAASLLFALAFPNALVEKGLPCAMWVAYIPLFLLIYGTKVRFAPLYGFFYGAFSMFLFNYWIYSFDAVAGTFVVAVFALYFAVFFLLLKAADVFFSYMRFSALALLVQCALWVLFEYLRTLGFLGYSYGITGYSQWTLPFFIKAADLGGVWLISALLIFPQAQIASLLRERFQAKSLQKTPRPFLRAARPLFVWLFLIALSLTYGFLSRVPYDGAKTIKVALLQPNSNPWKSGIDAYREEFKSLVFLSDLALSEEPPPALVVLPETAFVPSFYYHTRYKPNAKTYELVREAFDYFSSRPVPFLVGNDEAKPLPGDNSEIAHYNAVLLFKNGEIAERYYKTRLVPFSEYFPYKETFPYIYEQLDAILAHFWEPGNRAVVFELEGGVKFSSPVCFEDSFGYISRDFTRAGAQFIVNLTNDSWANSLAAQNVHLAMSVFRAVENRRAVVRSAVSGETCAISPYGEVIAEAPPFTQTLLSAEIPLLDNFTLYTRVGDAVPALCAALVLFAVLFGVCRRVFNRARAADAARG